MKILLATYSYYPYHWGGTEVYVSALAGFLMERGHQVTILAGMPPEAYVEHPVFYEDSQLKTISYHYEGVRVIGVLLKDQSTTEIYRKFRTEWVHSWALVLGKIGGVWDILHMHGNTTAIGPALIAAVKRNDSLVRVMVTWHLPLSCVKGTLMFGNKFQHCKVAPGVNICTACFASERLNLPVSFTRRLIPFLPLMPGKYWPTSLRLKFLVREFLQSLEELKKYVNMWHVFSENSGSVLQLNGVPVKKILHCRHGVDGVMFSSSSKRPVDGKAIFLYAGRFYRSKGFVTLLKAWKALPELKERELWIIGENPGTDNDITELIAILQARKDIQWLGLKSHEQVAEAMRKVHCTIIPSECAETGPLVFHEAIAAGSDVIASSIGGCEELSVLYQEKSTLFETGDVLSLESRITSFSYSGCVIHPLSQDDHYHRLLQSYQVLLKNEYATPE